MSKFYIKKPVVLAVSKKQLYLLLPFLGKMSALVNFGCTRSIHKRHKCLPFCKFKIVFKTSNSLKNYFSFEDVVPESVCSKFIILRAEAAMLHILVKHLGT